MLQGEGAQVRLLRAAGAGCSERSVWGVPAWLCLFHPPLLGAWPRSMVSAWEAQVPTPRPAPASVILRLLLGCERALVEAQPLRWSFPFPKGKILNPGQEWGILGVWVAFFFSPSLLGNINCIPDSFTLSLPWQPTAAQRFQCPIPEVGEETSPGGCC